MKNRLVNAERVVLRFLTSLITQGIFLLGVIPNNVAWGVSLGIFSVVSHIAFWIYRSDFPSTGIGLSLLLEAFGVCTGFLFNQIGIHVAYSLIISVWIAVWEFLCTKIVRNQDTEINKATVDAVGAETNKTTAGAVEAETNETTADAEDAVTNETAKDAVDAVTAKTATPVVKKINTPLLVLLGAAGIAGAWVLVTLRKKK